MTEEVTPDVNAEAPAEVTAEVPAQEPVETEVSEEAEVEQTTEEESSTPEEAEESAEESAEDLSPKAQNRFQQLANDNRALRNRLKELEELQVPTAQDYIDGGYDEVQAKVNALEASLQQRDTIEQITQLNNAVENDMVRIIHEYPELDPKSDKFSKDLAVKLFEQYDQDAGVKYSEDGIVLEAQRTPYEYIKEKMDLIGMASQKERVQAQKAVEKMVAQSETPTSEAPVKSSDDSVEALRERLSDLKF